MKFKILVSLCLFNTVLSLDTDHAGSNKRGSRKLFGGYRITPRFCKPTRKPEEPTGGPNICMFNHECLNRNGEVVGACMDGFLFGACCQLPLGQTIGDYLDGESISIDPDENYVSMRPSISPTTASQPPIFDITSSGVSHITAALLNPNVLPTAQDNAIIQVNNQSYFSTTGVTHPQAPDTILINQQDNDIDPGYFQPTSQPTLEDRKTTIRTEEIYANTPYVQISISNAPIDYTPSPGFHRPMFRPKPSKPPTEDSYVLVPTINHETKPNKTQEYDSIVNIIQMLNHTSTKNPALDANGPTNRPPSTSYIFSVTSTKRPGSETVKITSIKPPSTSYIFSTTVPPRRTESPTTTKKKPSPTKKTKPTKKPSTIIITKKPISTTYISPTKSTVANSPAAFITTQRPPSTSYVYSPLPTRRPPSTINTHIAGPGFSVTTSPSGILSTSTQDEFSSYPSPAPTLIVLGPVTENEIIPETHQRPVTHPTYEHYPATIHRPTAIPQRKPISHVTINNHVTQNIYSTSERPSPTVLITPKPSLSSSIRPQESDPDTIEVGTILPSPDDINFPPVRNPNLNMSIPSINEEDITTPSFIEDETLDANVEKFVNKIIQGLQDPFNGLRDIVYNKNKTTVLLTNASTTTKKPVKKQGVTTKKPTRSPTTRPTRPASSNVRPVASTVRPTAKPVSTKRPTTKRPITSIPTRTQSTTTRRTNTTRKPVITTTTESLIEHQTENVAIDSEDYRTQCGMRPMMKSGRIVGGKGATFGEFPWQVLVRESTWLGLFTKNKCGGVLISHKYVMTAAHCQPGFLASLVAVFGEFDISGDLESKRPISRNVRRVIVHRQYNAATFENDLALLELEQPVQFDSHIIPICLPRDGEDFTGRMATVTGWGRLKYGGGVPSVLQEVQVPIMENPVCQEMFRTAGHSKVILESFLCAGYANGQKDSCEGDSGGPLVLQRPDGRYQLAGTVSHGIKCAAPYLPGVYMRTQFFKPWITSITGVTPP